MQRLKFFVCCLTVGVLGCEGAAIPSGPWWKPLEHDDDFFGGSFTVTSSSDAVHISKYRTVSVALYVTAPGLVTLSLPELSSVGVTLAVQDNDALTSIELPALTLVPWLRFRDNEALTSIQLPMLAEVHSVSIEINQVLTNIELPALTGVHGLLIEGNEALTNIELPALTTEISWLIVRNNESLCQSIVDSIVARLREEGWTGEVWSGNNKPDC